MPEGRVLIVDDEIVQQEILRLYLESLPLECEIADGPQQAINLLAAKHFHAVLCDLVMPGGGGTEVLRFVQSRALHIPVIIVSGYGDEETAEECITAGAFDFVSKPVDRLSLVAVLRRALLRSGLIFNGATSSGSSKPAPKFPHLVGKSEAMNLVLLHIAKVAEADTNVCIYGESGTGKELVARAIHERSGRRRKPLVRVNCAAIPKELFESEFFGHVRGAFTGAIKDRVGRFELANGGTLFLDEVGEIPLDLQSKLLRVIQEGNFERVGEDRTRTVNVRLISATNRDLESESSDGRFRLDLYYRISVFPIEIPPLRERREDIVSLAEHFLKVASQKVMIKPPLLTKAQLKELEQDAWPGNVRELQNVIERATILAAHGAFTLNLGRSGRICPCGRRAALPSNRIEP